MKHQTKTRFQCLVFFIALLFSFNTLVLSFNALAKTSDEDAPLHIEADQLEIHDKDNFSIYTGNVIINKGSLKITGDKIIIRNKNAKLNSVKINGSPATFFQLNDLDEAINAESKVMDYQAQSGILELKQNAKLIKNKNHFSSEHIIYNTLNDIVKAGGQKSQNLQNLNPQKTPRVKITIYPDDKSPSETNQKQ